MIVVADTTPINYLIVIEQIDVLFALYGRVVLPVAVRDELLSEHAPAAVRSWMSHPPKWIEVRIPKAAPDAAFDKLDAGERDAILLAEELTADQVIIDEVVGRRVAIQRGIPVVGTIGVLRDAALAGLLDIHDAASRLRSTSFHIAPAILSAMLRGLPQR